MFLNCFQFNQDFIDYNVNACIYHFEILILTYSDFTFDNVNFDLRKLSGFKYILQLLNICLVFKEKIKDFCFINFILKEEIIVGKQLAEFISEN